MFHDGCDYLCACLPSSAQAQAGAPPVLLPASMQAAAAAASSAAATAVEEDALAGDYAATYSAMKEMMEIKLRHETNRADYLQVSKAAWYMTTCWYMQELMQAPISLKVCSLLCTRASMHHLSVCFDIVRDICT